MIHKIALNGFGRIGRIVFVGADSFALANAKTQNSTFAKIDLSELKPQINNKILVEAYNSVQHKYYPDKDVYKG